MNGKVSRSLRRVANVNRKEDGDRRYYHYNEQKAHKKQKADSSDPIISDTKRQVYQAAKKAFSHFKIQGVTNGTALSWVRSMIHETAQNRLEAKGNA